ncbi:MAG: hypothetical protein PVG49_15105 [Desulfobacteraceae bacterium]
MGVAFDWLGPEGCRALAREILDEPREKGREIWAHCPWHQERTPGGAFAYNFVKDQAMCLSCGQRGDLVAIWCTVNGYGPESREGFLEFKRRYGKDAPMPRRRPLRTRKERRRPLDPEAREAAPERWKERAKSFVFNSFDRLMGSPEALEELEKRWGITEQTVLSCGFGMNDKDKWPPVTSWGLPYEERGGKVKKIWLPQGLVMPLMKGDEVRKIKIRRPDPSTPWGEPRRYWEVLGGENYRFHCYGPADARVLVVIEAERDAALVVQECERVSLGAIAGGGAAKRPKDEVVTARIRAAEVVLVALDTDGAGATNALNYWRRNFDFTVHWPVPKEFGKDVGEAWQNGLDIQSWVQAGLPGWFRAGR